MNERNIFAVAGPGPYIYLPRHTTALLASTAHPSLPVPEQSTTEELRRAATSPVCRGAEKPQSKQATTLHIRMNMGSPNPNSSWLLSDNSRYSTQARLLFLGMSFAVGILTFLLYLCIWYLCTRRCRTTTSRTTTITSSNSSSEENSGGMSAAAIAALPSTFAWHDEEDDDRQAECAVCLGQVEPGEKARRLPACAHPFHAGCVDAWLRARGTCPLCRAPVDVVTKTDAAAAAKTVVVPAAVAAEVAALPPV